MEPEIVFDDELKRKLIEIIEISNRGDGHLLTMSEAVILFHWVRHQNEPQFDFVPAKYRTMRKG